MVHRGFSSTNDEALVPDRRTSSQPEKEVSLLEFKTGESNHKEQRGGSHARKERRIGVHKTLRDCCSQKVGKREKKEKNISGMGRLKSTAERAMHRRSSHSFLQNKCLQVLRPLMIGTHTKLYQEKGC
jgi:hypothetical protein